MRFLTSEECKELADVTGLEHPSERVIGGSLPTIPRLATFCRALESALQPYERLLLWVTQTGVWPSSEVLHLYYRLRQSYGDQRLIEEAPGHLFLKFESEDARSFIHLALVSGWDFHLIPMGGYGRGFVSHDEYWEIAFDNDQSLQSGVELLEGFQ